ncbi:unnamed protein product [Acanthoscelides obtectus]|uniref:HTH psq-type domain-containing protein n=1 Tax=Acanthoscelides obtectus TaxID=200917 RepID=A0A9P0PVN4_ACAOB|nr:unnamed protein product [Acanthoscelides obtectus]CAK1671369.1 hypothetical protein AOBTE_LOCUS28236 [Acanthoscelides obtectus]
MELLPQYVIMPRKYIRSNTARPRATWSDEQLMEAVAKVQTGEISKKEAHRRYNVPPRTPKRRIISGNFKKGALGPEGILGRANETRLVAHIHRLLVVGFRPARSTVRTFSFAERLGIKHPFVNPKMADDVHEKELNATKTSSSNSGMLQKTTSAESYSQVLKKPLYTNNDSSVLLLQFKSSSVALGLLYRPPKANLNSAVETLDTLLSHLSTVYDHIIILGDIILSTVLVK